jgi:beta-lactamase regulating signal transducer with metallopeptidase domain
MSWMVLAAISGPMRAVNSGWATGGIFAVLDAAARALLLAAVVWLGLRVLRAGNVVAQKAAWCLVLAGAAIMPALAPWAAKRAWLPAGATVVVPAHPWLRPAASAPDPSRSAGHALPTLDEFSVTPDFVAHPASSAVQPVNPVSSAALPGTGDRYPAPLISNSTGSSGESRPAAPAIGGMPGFVTIAWLLYGLVCGALLLRLFYGLGASLAVWQSAEPVWTGAATSHSHGLRVRSSARISSPVTIASGIVLPSSYVGWDAEKLRIVLAHERSHVRQGDFYLQALAGLYTALFWFSPLGWWLKRKLSDLGEAISDHAGLEEAASPVSYAQILLEFAAMPRPTLSRIDIGVAMARTGRLTHRVERLLNENRFRQAFSGGRGRVFAAVLLVPFALFAATALIRVEASAQAPQAPTPPPPPVTGESHPESAPDVAAPVAPASSEPEPAAHAPVVRVAPVAPAPPLVHPATAEAPLPPEPPAAPDTDSIANAAPWTSSQTETNTSTGAGKNYAHSGTGPGYSYSYSSNGDSYAVISGNNQQHVQFSGEWIDGRKAELDKARRMAHGDFLWFTHGGKSYVLDDPALVTRIQQIYGPMDELGQRQDELGRQQEELGRQQEKLGRQQELASIPTPDLSREMAELNQAVARLQARKNGNITQDQLTDLQGKIGDLQGKLGELQGEMGAKQGQLGGLQGKLGEQQGKLGAQQGRLGAEQGRLAQQADKVVKSIIDQSLRDGKARPVD